MKKGVSVIVMVSLLALAVCLTVFATVFAMVYGGWRKSSASSETAQKVSEIEEILDTYFVGEYDKTQMGDTVAEAMIESTGDHWSYYVPASSYNDFQEAYTNSYCGIGITIQDIGDANGFSVTSVTEGGPAWEAGVRTGDILHQVEGKLAAELGLDETKNRVRGDEGTTVSVTFLREGSGFAVEVTRRKIQTVVAEGTLLEEGVGYVTIKNFDETSAAQTIGEIKKLLEQGADSLILDVRFNPGGHKDELVEILDYLLPEGVIFREKLYSGKELETTSDASCVDVPMAVLINQDSYSAAEFLAAALQEYDYALIVGEQTVGKGRYQYTFDLSDGSMVSVSVGTYYTPEGKSLQDVGVIPDVAVSMTDEQLVSLYYSQLDTADDPQLQAAIAALQK